MLKRQAEWVLLEGHMPGVLPTPIGILLAVENDLHLKLRPNWWHILSEEGEAEMWSDFEMLLIHMAEEIGGVQVLDWLEEAFSHAFRISARHTILVADAGATLEVLYQAHVCSVRKAGRICDVILGAVRMGRRSNVLLWTGKHRTWKASLCTFLALAAIISAVLVLGRGKISDPLPNRVSPAPAIVDLPPLPSTTFGASLDLDDSLLSPLGRTRSRRRRVATHRHKAIQVDNWDPEPQTTASLAPLPPPPHIPLISRPVSVVSMPAIPVAPAFRQKPNRLQRFFRFLHLHDPPKQHDSQPEESTRRNSTSNTVKSSFSFESKNP